MRVCLITGSLPPEACGVGDYTSKLGQALERAGVTVSVFRTRPSRLDRLARIRGEISRRAPDIAHIQYPTVGYGRSLLPHALALTLPIPLVTTLHEYSQTHRLRRASLLAFARGSQGLVFTDDYEQRLFHKRFPVTADVTSHIPVGSSISSASGARPRRNEVVYFGLLRPKRGLERFLELASLIRSQNLDYKMTIIGKPDERYLDYFSSVRDGAAQLGIELAVGLSEDEVAQRLAAGTFAYHAYPDGASLRRTSLLAGMTNGLIVVTTRGPRTPESLSRAVVFASTPADALARMERLSADGEDRDKKSVAAQRYAERFTWESIATAHVRVYERVRARSAR